MTAASRIAANSLSGPRARTRAGPFSWPASQHRRTGEDLAEWRKTRVAGRFPALVEGRPSPGLLRRYAVARFTTWRGESTGLDGPAAAVSEAWARAGMVRSTVTGSVGVGVGVPELGSENELGSLGELRAGNERGQLAHRRPLVPVTLLAGALAQETPETISGCREKGRQRVDLTELHIGRLDPGPFGARPQEP